MSSTIGGLLQLIATGIQDTPIINNPEITFFKKVYKKTTNFAICGNERNLGLLRDYRENSINIEDTGDLLYNLYFQIYIEDKNIINTNMVSNIYYDNTLINQFDIIYNNNYCLIFYSKLGKWYIIPYSILLNKNITFIEKNLNTFPFLSNISINNRAIYYQISNKDVIKKKIVNITSEIPVPIYWDFNIIISNGEIQQYYNYINNIIVISKNYDIDIVNAYCLNNFLDFRLYKDYIYSNSIIILIILRLLYNNNNLIFTYWKKYNVYINNEINYLAPNNNNNFSNEWKENIDNIIKQYFNTNIIYNQIYDSFSRNYLLTSVV
jgi:hypothetical protein